MLYLGKGDCIRATWFYSGNVVVFGQCGCIRAKVVVFGQICSIRAFLLYSDSGFIRGKVVVFGQKWLF